MIKKIGTEFRSFLHMVMSRVSLNIKILKVQYELISITKVNTIYLRVFMDALGSNNYPKNTEIKKK